MRLKYLPSKVFPSNAIKNERLVSILFGGDKRNVHPPGGRNFYFVEL